MTGWRLLPMGDRAVLVDCADSAVAAAVTAALSGNPVTGQRDLVPGAASVLVITDAEVEVEAMARHLAAAELTSTAPAAVRDVTIDVVYDGEDLAEVAELTGLGIDGVIAAHTGTPWRVAFTGFAPGFGYLTGGDARLRVPRRGTPRAQVPAGSVGLAGGYSGVYPRASPGGWQLIGRTPAVLWDLHRDPPALLQPGTVVHFRAVAALARPPVPPVVSATTRDGASSASQPDSGTGASPGSRTLIVVRPGISCLVEDLGRPGMAAQGLSRSGAADRGAAQRANRIVGNRVGAAVLEVIPGRFAARAGGPLLVAVTGAAAEIAVVGGFRRRDSPIALGVGHTLTITAPSVSSGSSGPSDGLRCYLAVRGGIAVDSVLGSRSSDLLAGIGPASVRAGDVLPIGTDSWGTPRPVAPPPPPESTGGPGITVLPGPQTDWFRGGLSALAGRTWQVSTSSNRVGVRLEGPPLTRTTAGEVPTQGLVPGAIQVPPDGRPVIVLVDHPVTGGYPVIGVVPTSDLDAVAQLRPGAAVHLLIRPGETPASGAVGPLPLA